MAHSNAKTVEEYLSSLPPEKAKVMSKLREMMLANIPEGFKETMNWGMISYELPLKTYPDTYNGQPLSYAALAAQKNHFAIYSTNLYMNEKYLAKLINEYDRIGVKPNIGKSCIRFTQLTKIPLEYILKIIKDSSVEAFIADYEKSRHGTKG